MINNFLHFSDAAKFALIARNLAEGNGYITDFSFWGNPFFSTGGIPRLLPYIISIFFKAFGVNDFAVIAFSLTFFILTVLAVYLLADKLYGKLVGILSAVVVALNLDLINYAFSGASETLFIFEIVLGAYFITLKKKWSSALGVLVLATMYFTRPQAFVFIGALFLFWLLVNFGIKKGIYYFLGLSVFAYFFDRLVLYPLSFKLPITSVFGRGFGTIFTYSSKAAVSDSLRGGVVSTLGLTDVVKKVFYNLYNFYKAIPEIFNPYIFGLFLIGLFTKAKSKLEQSFRLTSVFAILLTFLITALSIPFYRYLHPVLPLVSILGVAAIVDIFKNHKQKVILSIFLILFFVVGQTLGHFVLDSRFENKLVNKDKPPVYALLSYKLKEFTNKEDIVLTNLDTWGSWYGERKTVWYPLTVAQFVPEIDKFDAIYLTSYKKDDDNYYMGEDWRLIYANPDSEKAWVCEGCEKITEQFDLKQVFVIPESETYENEEGIGVLLVRKTNSN